MHNRFISFLAFSLFFLLFTSCDFNSGPNTQAGDEEDRFIVGANLTLTGSAAHWGTEIRDGLAMGFEESSSLFENGSIDVRFEDNMMNPREAVSIAKKFTDIDKVDLMISTFSPFVKSTMNIAERKEVLMLATLTSAVDIAKGKDWIFRDFVPESVYMPLLADYAYQEEKFVSGTYLVVNDDFGRDARRFFELAFTSQGGTLLGGEFFESADLDLRNKVDKILNSRPEFVLVVGRGSAMINACRQIREVNKEIRIYSGAGIDDPKIWQGLGSVGDGVIFARIYYDEQDPEFININEKFKSKYGCEMTWVNVYGYTIARYLSKGFSIAGKDKEKMRTYLRTLNFSSIRGQLVMNDNSDVVTPIKIYIRGNSVSRQITTKKY